MLNIRAYKSINNLKSLTPSQKLFKTVSKANSASERL
jgi:hypothetical protein